ncbi:PREDICTED: nudC domain-containing protein 1 isoform X1 [Rhagoletis zephyria]|uniref:nudC domain-containing protein 1 isoform X1 n=1 Tax=Rhagoletis zephyria TaxID=28612 RepID=UPI0008114DF3|nr:PREDICTED: nudC domain-containing protein 1 isoform X1 [Rhagoletis zephyria]
MPKIVELRSNRSLLQSNFDGYKLSLDPVALLRQELPYAPHKAEPNEDQYSLLHAELFSMQNLLQVDPWARTDSYYVSRLGEVVRAAYNEPTGRAESVQVVYRLSTHTPRVKGDYNYSMRFISEKYCVLCDGIQHLFLLDTNDRTKAAKWKLIAETPIVAFANSISSERNFCLYDCRLDIVQEEKQISLAVGRVERDDSSSGGGSKHFMHLHWAKWIHNKEWLFSILDTLEGKGSLYYCAFEPRAESIIICSNHEYTFRSKKSSDNKENTDKIPLYKEVPEINGFTWTQTDDDITIKFDVKKGKERTDYSVKYAADKLTVKCCEEVLFDSQLFGKVDQDLTTWTIENNYLQITLVKRVLTLNWPSLLCDNVGPEETLDKSRQSDLPIDQRPIVNLEAPIEDCDFPMSGIEEEIRIGRYHLSTKSITHAVLLGSSPPLFSTNLRPGFPNALAIRQDVDAGLWLQNYNPNKPEDWSLRHEANLHAFGYVQASKQQRKFIDCSPDFNYALICESHRHVFLYKSNYDGADGLRNRNGPQVRLGKQHLVTLEDAGEVLGLATAESVVTILTERCLLHLQLS